MCRQRTDGRIHAGKYSKNKEKRNIVKKNLYNFFFLFFFFNVITHHFIPWQWYEVAPHHSQVLNNNLRLLSVLIPFAINLVHKLHSTVSPIQTPARSLRFGTVEPLLGLVEI
jgi:hypothetical protein